MCAVPMIKIGEHMVTRVYMCVVPMIKIGNNMVTRVYMCAVPMIQNGDKGVHVCGSNDKKMVKIW